MFTGLRTRVSGDCYAEACEFRHRGVGVCRLLGEALAGFAIEGYRGLQPGVYHIARGDKGKPYLVDVDDLFFNISHSGEYVVCALSDREVGVDIEKRTKARMAVAWRFFHEREVKRLEASSGEVRDRLFFDYWSVKESFLKYVGTGLTRPLNSFIVTFSAGRIVLHEEGKRSTTCVHACAVDAGYACHVCGEYDGEPEVVEVTLKEIMTGE